MKYKKIMIASLILLAILTIGAVSAEDSLTPDNDTLTAEVDDVDVLADDEKQDFDYDVMMPSEVYTFGGDVSDETQIQFTIPWEHDGNVSVLIDDEEKYNKETKDYWDNIYPIDMLPLLNGLNYNTNHNIVVNYFGDTDYKNYTFSKTIKYDFIKFNVPEAVEVSGSNRFSAIVPDSVDGTLTLYIDGKKYDSSEFYDGNCYVYYYPETFTKHTYKLEFKDNEGQYPTRSVSGSFETTFRFSVDYYDEYIDVGENATFEVYLPDDATGNVEVTYNGKTKKVKYEEYGSRITLDDLKLGKNNITFKYTYQKKTRSITHNVEVRPIIRLNTDVRYNSDDGFYLKIPADAKGDVDVYVDGEKIPTTLENGELKVVLSGFDAKTSHILVYNYTGDDFELEGIGEEHSFVITPHVYYPKGALITEDFEVTIEMPEDGNGTFTFYVGGAEISSVPVTNGKAKIIVPKDTLQEDDNGITFYYDGNYHELGISDGYIVGHKYPSNISLEMGCSDTLIKGMSNYMYHNLPGDARGEISVYLKGKKIYTFGVDSDSYVYSLYAGFVDDLNYGTYNITFAYSGDGYYKASSQSKIINVSYYRIDCDENIVIGENDDFYIQLANAAPTVASLYINGKLYQTGKFIEHDGERYWIAIHFDLSKLACGEYNDVKVVYKGNAQYPGFTNYLKFNVTYGAEIENYDYYYEGDYVQLNVTFAVDLTGNASMVIDDKTYTAEIKDKSALFNVSSFVGEKNVTINYGGNDKYPARSIVKTVSITPLIETPYTNHIKDAAKVSLILPKDANGNLTVKLIKQHEDEDDEILQEESVALINGKAEISLVKLNLGNYRIEAKYTGADYEVDNRYDSYGVSPNITSKSIYVGEDFNFFFEMPEDAGGILNVHINGEDIERELVNGKANFTLKNLPYGEYFYSYTYTGGKYGSVESDEDVELYFNVDRNPVKLSPAIPKEIIANNPFKLTFKAQKDLTGMIEVYIGDEYQIGYFKNGVATVSIKSTQSGNVTVRFSYDGDEKYDYDWGEFTINVLKPVKLTSKDQSVFYNDGSTFKVTAYDSFGKLVGAGEVVTFYIDGKKVGTAKTDKNGVAALKITKLPKTYKVKATYKGASVTKKLTVKHILTLKTATVKKSAKKLVLQATLKNKKAIKGKTVTFKFNGKTYKAKTNKYGIAKVTIKKSVLKKLKKGKKVTYQATYLKDTVKKTAKVKK